MLDELKEIYSMDSFKVICCEDGILGACFIYFVFTLLLIVGFPLILLACFNKWSQTWFEESEDKEL